MSLLFSKTCGTSNIDERESEGGAEKTADLENYDNDEMDDGAESVSSELAAITGTASSDDSRPNSHLDSFDFHDQAVRNSCALFW